MSEKRFATLTLHSEGVELVLTENPDNEDACYRLFIDGDNHLLPNGQPYETFDMHSLDSALKQMSEVALYACMS